MRSPAATGRRHVRAPTLTRLGRHLTNPIEGILLAIVPIATLRENRGLSNASGFFFAREGRLYLVTSRHVFFDSATSHYPDELFLDVHTDEGNLAETCDVSVPLYREGIACWQQGGDDAGDIDVAVIELDTDTLPRSAAYCAFTPAHLHHSAISLELGTHLLIVGFPLGLRDTLHHVPVARQAIIASSFGLRFSGLGYFLTDGLTHSDSSGAPVVMREHIATDELGKLPYRLLGVHSTRLEPSGRGVARDEALNCAWYADVLMALTQRS